LRFRPLAAQATKKREQNLPAPCLQEAPEFLPEVKPMFEDAMMESGGRIKTKSKYYTIVGVIINCSILAALILYPLLNPEALPKSMMTTMLVAPPPPAAAPAAPASGRADQGHQGPEHGQRADRAHQDSQSHQDDQG
jgi:hypothetical protein